MSKKSQQELEQPAKVYQVDAVESKVDDLKTLVNTFSLDVNRRLDTLITKADGLVTEHRLTERITDMTKEMHLEYGPLKRNIDWFSKAVIAEGIAIVGQAVILYLIARG